ncbi:hypothetical protein [Bythopirellula goksoeyrii]|uniref:Probable pectate lyase C n=1 Tax=Bythopirellula goksoeyrii TaxID=1400387 RepID=A0A5B9QF08_9BACT|nr:hypothetical protein [Bythopirellula goksoeyrii]QEG36469.1 hypothetical protein Pr1d_37830 [Bythopirellula goksoeyrii]
MKSLFCSCKIAICVLLAIPCHAAESQWVQTGATGRLVYVPDAEGDRIMEFSDVGYRGRGIELIPNDVPTVVTVSPVAGDDTASIQAAINQVSSMPLGSNGFRGAVLLEAGDYDIATNLTINTSGVVLRGVGRESNETVLHARGTGQRSLIEVEGSGSQSLTGSTRNMIDKVVPVGSRSFRVDSTSGFTVGDTVRVTRPTPNNWFSDLGMDMIPPRSDGGTVYQWTDPNVNIKLEFDRVITRIEGDRIFVDAPLPQSFDQTYGGGTIRRYTWNNRIQNVGIENLRGESDFTSPTDENHGWEFISIDDAQNVWVQNTLSKYFGDSAVVANPSAKWVTVDNAINESPVSVITGSRRYTFDLSGELGLVTNSVANEGRHDFVNNSTQPGGPNVFHNSVAHTALDETGPHQRWATGTLFDNITIDGDQINARNRGNFGTGHGWAGANMVIWNSTADSFIVQNPPTSQNWLVGSAGTIIEDTTFGPQPQGYYDQSGPGASPVIAGGSTSLYDAQMNDSRDIREYHAQGTGKWTDGNSWDQSIAPEDAYKVSLRDYLIGDIDEFVFDGSTSVDNAFIDPAWETAITTSSALPITGFDNLSGNQNVAFTIQHALDVGEKVVHGFVALGLKQSAGGLVDTDFIRLFDTDPAHRFNFSDLGWDTQIDQSGTFVGVLDLGAYLDQLQSGAVNVQINDDTGVDWAIYTITAATPLNDSASTKVYIDGGAAIQVDTAVGSIGELHLGGASPGTLALASTGTVSIAHDFTQSSSGSLALELAVGGLGSLNVLGNANVGGSLTVDLDELLSPAAGDTFELISANSVNGEFQQTNLPELASGLTWNLAYNQADVTLSVLYSADFNADGTVDNSDLVDWQNGYGMLSATHQDGDADGDGDVDAADFLMWQRQFGSSSLPSTLSANVPEPHCCQLLASLVVIAALTCRPSPL